MLKMKNVLSVLEILSFLAVIAVVSYVAIPNVIRSVDNSRKSMDISNGAIILNSAKKAFDTLNAEEGLEVLKGTYNFSETSITGNANMNESQKELVSLISEDLKNDFPQPKYKKNGAVHFQLVIDESNEMTINNGDGEEVAPHPDASYYQQ